MSTVFAQEPLPFPRNCMTRTDVLSCLYRRLHALRFRTGVSHRETRVYTPEMREQRTDWRCLSDLPRCKNCGENYGNVYYGAAHWCANGYAPIDSKPFTQGRE